MKYRPEVDGLRALAVIPVMLFHAGFQTFSGGYVGVDVFFVISGYLITSIILTELEAGTFRIVDFYERRARRILPALFCVVLVSLPVAWLLLTPADLKHFMRSVAAVAVFSSNILFWRESGYFDTAAELKPLLHTWSLAVEEQFYVLFPLFLMAAWRLARLRLVALLAIGAVLSLAFAQWAALYKPEAAFFLLPTRAWELALGSLLAVHLAHAPRPAESGKLDAAGGLAGLALILASVFLFDEKTPFPGLYALVPTVGAALVILCARPSNPAGAILASRWPVGVGLISYSAYLWHQPLLAFARHAGVHGNGPWVMGAMLAATLVLAYLTWRLVEQPFRSRTRIGKRVVFTVAVAFSAAFLALGVIGYKADGWRAYYEAHRLSPQEAEVYRLVRTHTGHDLSKTMFDDAQCRFWSADLNPQFEQRFRACAARLGKAVVVLGDSHAMNAYNIFAKAGASPFLVGLSRGGCRPHDNHARCHYDAFDRFLSAHVASIRTVVFHQSGSYFLRDRRGAVDSDLAFTDDATFDLHDANVQAVRRYLNRMGGKVDTVWLGPFVEARLDLARLHRSWASLQIPAKNLEQFARLDGVLKATPAPDAGRYRYVSFIDVLKVDAGFLRRGSCITYNDGDHYSGCGEDLLAPRVAAALASGVIRAGPD